MSVKYIKLNIKCIIDIIIYWNKTNIILIKKNKISYIMC